MGGDQRRDGAAATAEERADGADFPGLLFARSPEFERELALDDVVELLLLGMSVVGDLLAGIEVPEPAVRLLGAERVVDRSDVEVGRNLVDLGEVGHRDVLGMSYVVLHTHTT